MTPTYQNSNLPKSLNIFKIQNEAGFIPNPETNSKLNKYLMECENNISPQQSRSYNFFPSSHTPNSNTIKSFNFPNTISPQCNKYNLNTIDFKPKLPLNFNTTQSDFKYIKNEDILDHKINLENILIGKDKRTTLMLRNIPNKYSIQNIIDEIIGGFGGKYDYINMPVDYERKLNLGYAFINFVDPLHIILFYETYHNKKWTRYRSDKVILLFIIRKLILIMLRNRKRRI